MKVVLDTNVLMSAFAARGLCEAVYQVCLAKHEIVVCEHILKELRKNLPRKLKLSAEHADEILAQIRENVEIIRPAKLPANACRDRGDLPVLGTLIAAHADCLITGDRDLLSLGKFRGVPILPPRGFHDLIR